MDNLIISQNLGRYSQFPCATHHEIRVCKYHFQCGLPTAVTASIQRGLHSEYGAIFLSQDAREIRTDNFGNATVESFGQCPNAIGIALHGTIFQECVVIQHSRYFYVGDASELVRPLFESHFLIGVQR